MNYKYVACPRNCFDGCMFVYNGSTLLPRKDHPGVDGITCPKSQYILGVATHPERLVKPLMRKGDYWEEITLSDALDIAAREIERHKRVIRIDYSGNMMLLSRRFHHRLFHVLGAPDVRWDICAEAGTYGLKQSWGVGYGSSLPSMKDSDVVIIWGSNVKYTSIHAYTYALQTKQSGGRVFVVDVMNSETAKDFELVKVNPGGDVAFALQIIQALAEMVEDIPIKYSYSNDDLQRISGVNREVVYDIARAIKHANKPFIFMGYGFQRRKNGGMAVRLISLIPYITHRLPLFYYDRPAYGIDLDYVSGKHLWQGETFSLTQMAQHIQNIDNAVFVVMNANPVNTLPKGSIIAEVLKRPSNFTIVHDLFMTDTAKVADLVIPAAASVEYEDVMITYGHDYVGWNDKILSPPLHTINNMDLAREIAKRLSLKELELYESDMSVIKHVLEKAGVDIAALREKGFAPLPTINPRKEPVFPSQDDIEPYIQPLKDRGFNLLTPSYRFRIHSQYWALRKDEELLQLSPEDAQILGLSDGDRVVLRREGFSYEIKVSISDDITQGTVKVFHGVWGSKLNDLVNINLSDMGPNSIITDTYVEIQKISSKN